MSEPFLIANAIKQLRKTCSDNTPGVGLVNRRNSLIPPLSEKAPNYQRPEGKTDMNGEVKCRVGPKVVSDPCSCTLAGNFH